MCVYVCVRVCVRVYVRLCTCVCICVHMCVCVCIHIRMHVRGVLCVVCCMCLCLTVSVLQCTVMPAYRSTMHLLCVTCVCLHMLCDQTCCTSMTHLLPHLSTGGVSFPLACWVCTEVGGAFGLEPPNKSSSCSSSSSSSKRTPFVADGWGGFTAFGESFAGACVVGFLAELPPNRSSSSSSSTLPPLEKSAFFLVAGGRWGEGWSSDSDAWLCCQMRRRGGRGREGGRRENATHTRISKGIM